MCQCAMVPLSMSWYYHNHHCHEQIRTQRLQWWPYPFHHLRCHHSVHKYGHPGGDPMSLPSSSSSPRCTCMDTLMVTIWTSSSSSSSSSPLSSVWTHQWWPYEPSSAQQEGDWVMAQPSFTLFRHRRCNHHHPPDHHHYLPDHHHHLPDRHHHQQPSVIKRWQIWNLSPHMHLFIEHQILPEQLCINDNFQNQYQHQNRLRQGENIWGMLHCVFWWMFRLHWRPSADLPGADRGEKRCDKKKWNGVKRSRNWDRAIPPTGRTVVVLFLHAFVEVKDSE